MKKICLVSTLNPSDDIRIYRKEAVSLSKQYKVTYICPKDGKGICETKNLNHIFIEYPKNKLKRISNLWTIKSILNKKKFDLIHIQNPELLMIVPFLKSKVIFDMHEDFEEGIKDKEWIPKYFRELIAYIYSKILRILMKYKLSTTIVTTPLIAEKFLSFKNVYIIENYAPLVKEEELFTYHVPVEIQKQLDEVTKKTKLVFTGLINKQRGILEVIESLRFSEDTVLFLIGICEREFKNEINVLTRLLELEGRVFLYDSVSFEEMLASIKKMDIGVLPYLPYRNHKVTRPNKLFEYMLCGIPIIASNYPLYKEVVEQGAGISVDPTNIGEIANAVNTLKKIDLAKDMGLKGSRLYQTKYNWIVEEKKLLNIYQDILGD